jgi:hypothetical protein
VKNATLLSLAVAGVLSAGLPPCSAADEPPKVKIPQPGVPQVMTLEGRYVRVAYNNEGYVVLGYRLANLSVGQPWMLLETGFSLREGVRDYDMKREAVTLETPDGKTIPLATTREYREAETQLRALQAREKVQRDSINYFPPNAYQACRVGFFADLGSPAHAWDHVELTDRRGCLGRLYFEVPGGIAHGQHWLNVQFKDSLVRVPFRILTKEEDEMLDKSYRDIEKQVKNAFRKKS